VGEIRRASQLTSAEVAGVLRLAHAAGDADGADPLSEHIVARLTDGRASAYPAAIHLLAASADGPVGYANLDLTDPVAGPSGELCVHPLHRRNGVGRALVLAAINAARQHDATGRLRLWAHGDHPSANALAIARGLRRVRSHVQMRRPLTDDLPAPVLAEGVVLREFRPGAADDAWVAVNARAFVDLPAQGSLSSADLRAKLAQPWFDPAGFLVAERTDDAAMLGFHWTKIHNGHIVEGHFHSPIGEVYVLGVDPSAHGTGLGKALTLAGLRYLRDRGLDEVMLYVESTNLAAIHLYERLGFVRWLTHVCFSR
jgi:mycothiol synthase